VKYIPSITVIIKLETAWEWLFSIILWWDQVTVTPEAKRMIVFKRGT